MFNWYIKISRPRFWIYLFGPFLIGAIAAGQVTNVWQLLLLGAYFTLPANLFIYGINDIYDYDTDKHNPKKAGYEELVTPDKQKRLARVIFICNLLPLLVMPFVPLAARWALVGFFFFGAFYSATPIRAKTKPLLDTVFNILYIFPAFVSYGLLTGQFPALQIVLAGTLWCMAMHAYSAVPDIKADRQGKIATVATLLGARGTLLFCLACYLLSAALSYRYLQQFSVIAGLIYAVMMLVSLLNPGRDQVFRLYKYFPYINMAVGAGLFFWVLYLVK